MSGASFFGLTLVDFGLLDLPFVNLGSLDCLNFWIFVSSEEPGGRELRGSSSHGIRGGGGAGRLKPVR